MRLLWKCSTQEYVFDVSRVRLHSHIVEFVYQGHPVRVKVTAVQSRSAGGPNILLVERQSCLLNIELQR